MEYDNIITTDFHNSDARLKNTKYYHIPKYKVVEKGDISTAQLTRKAFWIVVDQTIDEDTAKEIALRVSACKDIDEVSVYIYDNRRGALNGIIQYKLFDVILVKGVIVQIIGNMFYK